MSPFSRAVDRWGSTARHIIRRMPCEQLAPYVKSMVILDRAGQDADQVHVLPDEHATLLFSVAPGTRLTSGGRVADGEGMLMLLGPPTRAYARRFTHVPLTIVVTFRPAGAYLFSGASMCQLTDCGVGLPEFVGDAGQRLRGRLLAADSHQERLDLLEGFLIERLEGCSTRALRATRMVDEAVGLLQRRCSEQGDASADAGAAEPPASKRQLRRLFKTVVGVNPHALVRIERFHQALDLARAATQPQWADIAARCGYFDQSHMIAEFKAFAGASPHRVLPLLKSGLPHLDGSWFSETNEAAAFS
jgi:AraC-like DNA-binding protein